MFDFEKLDVYQIAHETNIKTLRILFSNAQMDAFFKEQWKRASLSIVLNLAEGVGRFSNGDKKHFLTMARGSVFECVALMKTALELGWISESRHAELYAKNEQISKMLLGMFRSYGADKK
jgi:four helix bundle protein